MGDLAFDEYLTLFTEKEYDGRVFNEFIVTELKNNGLLNHPVIELIERIDDEVGSFVLMRVWKWVQKGVNQIDQIGLGQIGKFKNQGNFSRGFNKVGFPNQKVWIGRVLYHWIGPIGF